MKVLLIDDHALFAKSLSIALSDFPDIEKFTSSKDISNLDKLISQDTPDIILQVVSTVEAITKAIQLGYISPLS